MMSIEFQGLDSLMENLRKHPLIVREEIEKYLIRAKAEIQKVYTKSPWKVGQNGGGIPKDKGNLMKKGTGLEVNPNSIVFFVDDRVPYGKYVHGRDFGEINERTGVESRPWLYFAKQEAEPRIIELQDDMLDSIINNLKK